MQHSVGPMLHKALDINDKARDSLTLRCNIIPCSSTVGDYNRGMESRASTSRINSRILDWVAMIDRLVPDDRPGLAGHFLSLESSDRHLRFGGVVSDDHIRRYVDSIDFGVSWVYGIRDGRGGWVGIGHLSPLPDGAELGLSVVPAARGRGLGAAIFRFAVAQASRDGAERLYMHCLTSNQAILSIARSAGMAIGSSGGEADAWLRIPPQDELVRLLMNDAQAA